MSQAIKDRPPLGRILSLKGASENEHCQDELTHKILLNDRLKLTSLNQATDAERRAEPGKLAESFHSEILDDLSSPHVPAVFCDDGPQYPWHP
jgi:hypothetical protein